MPVQKVYLVFHQGDEWRHYQRNAGKHKRGELVAQRFAAAGGKHGKRGASGEQGADDLFLPALESIPAEMPREQFGRVGIHRFRRGVFHAGIVAQTAAAGSLPGARMYRTGVDRTRQFGVIFFTQLVVSMASWYSYLRFPIGRFAPPFMLSHPNPSFFCVKLASRLASMSALSLVFGVGAIGAATFLATAPVFAQNEKQPAGSTGEIISPGSAPFTETFDDIQKRDEPYAEALRKGTYVPKRIVIPNVMGKELERELRKFIVPSVDETPVKHSVVPFMGRMDTEGHYLPAPTTKTDTLQAARLAPQSAGTTINGLTLATTQQSIPPDTQGAVGPNHAMILVNSNLAIYNKATGVRIGNIVTLDSFFAVTSGGTSYPRAGSYDPRVVYDRLSGRWFATNMEFGRAAGDLDGDGLQDTDDNDVILAVSRTSDPTGTWDKYVIPFGELDYFTDYSTLGVDDNGVYFAAAMFPYTNANSFKNKLLVVPKASLIAASPSIGAITQFSPVTGAFGTPQPALNLDGTGGGRAYFVYSSNANFGNLRYRTVTWSGTTPTLFPAVGATATQLTTPAFGGQPPTAPALGSTQNIDAGDFRLQMAIIRNNQIWCTRTVGVDSAGGSTAVNRAAGEWLNLNIANPTATLVQSGRIFDTAASDPMFYYYPSVAVSGQGHAAVGFSGSKSTIPVGVYTAGRLSTDAAGTLQGILSVKPGNQSYTVTYGGPKNRWGDYSYTAVDPNDDQTIWTFQEYTVSTNNWGTWGQQLRAPAPVASAITAPAGQGQQGQPNVTFQLKGTGFFDPGTSTPAFLNRLTATVDGTGVSNVRAYYINPTTIGIQANIAVGAPLGNRNVTITNPDGQAITVNNALRIVAAPATTARLTITRTLARVSGVVRATYTITNPAGSGVTFSNVRVTGGSVVVGGITTQTNTTPLPIVIGSLTPGASAQAVLSFPGTVGVAGAAAVITMDGTHSAGSFGSGGRVTLP